MKLIFFILFSLFLSSLLFQSAFATSIAISPAIIEINSPETVNSFILINSNNKDVNFSIKSTSNGIMLKEASGILESNSNKEIKFQTSGLRRDSYLIISFESENSISPAITLKLKKNYNETAEQSTMLENQEVKIPEAEQPNQPEISQKNKDLIYIVPAIFILLSIPIFLIYSGKKYRIGRIGQRLRIFINKLS